MKRPLLYPLIALTSGILFGNYLSIPLSLLLILLLSVLAGLLLCLKKKRNAFAFGLLLFLMVLTGFFNIQRQHILSLNAHHIRHLSDSGTLTIEGTVLSQDSSSPGLQSLIVRCHRIVDHHSYRLVTGKIRLLVPAQFDWLYGDFVRFRTHVKKIQGFHNPGVFDYRRHNYRKGIFVSGFVSDRAGIVLIRRNPNGSWKTKLERYRLTIKKLIADHAPSPEKEILEAIILGNAKAIPQSVRDDFAKTGTSHILAVSGLHVGMVAAAGFFLFYLILKSSEYLLLKFHIIKVATLAAFIPVIFYACVAGWGTTVMRAAFMALACLLAVWLEKKSDLYNILFGVALIILILSPESLFSISFQLSFSAVFSILFIVQKFNTPQGISNAPEKLRPLLRRLFIFTLVSAAATLGTLPVLIYYFNRISLVSILANFVVVPIVGFLALIPSLFSVFVAAFFPGLAGLLIEFASFFTAWAVRFVHWTASLPWTSLTLVKPYIFEILLLYGFLWLSVQILAPPRKRASGFFERHGRLAKILWAISLLFLLADTGYFFLNNRWDPSMSITAIDVGQGSSTFIRLPHGTTMLIDGGGFRDSSFDMGRSVIAPFLYARRIRQIDIVVLTHPHPDHLQGLIYILNHFNVREVWCTGQSIDTDLYRLWKKTLLENHIQPTYLCAQSPQMSISGVIFQCLWPLTPLQFAKNEAADDEVNDTSLVLKIRFGTTRFLITGDISSQVESVLLGSGNDIKSDLLFVPHHGSPFSSSPDFLRDVSCRYAVISSGHHNRFGHPHPTILKRYASNGIRLFRTDEDGAISIHSDGKNISLSSYHKKPFPKARLIPGKN